MKTLSVSLRFARQAHDSISDNSYLRENLNQTNSDTWIFSNSDEEIEPAIREYFDMAGIPETEYEIE